MAFTPKEWRDYPDMTTPIDAAAMIDLETRVTDYTFGVSSTVNVTDYGATGDGVTDDTAAFTSAIASNQPVFVPAGTYIISSRVTSNNLYGPGAASAGVATLKASASFAGTPILLKPNSDAVIEGITVDCNSVSGLYGIHTQGNDRCVIRDVTVKNVAGGVQGVLIDTSSTDCRVEGVYFTSITANNCLSITGTRSKAINCTSDGCNVASGHYVVTGAENEIRGCDVTNVTAGTRRPGIEATGNYLKVIGCEVDLTGSSNSVSGTATGIKISGTGIRVIGNVIKSAAGCGVLMATGSLYCTVSGNDIYNCASNGILTSTVTHDTTGGGHAIVGNTIHTVTGGNGALGQEDVGIEVQSPATTVAGNTIIAAGNHGIGIFNTGFTVVGNSVSGCCVAVSPVSSNPGSGIAGAGCSNGTIVGNVVLNSGGATVAAKGINLSADATNGATSGVTVQGNRVTDTRSPKYQTYGLNIAESGGQTVTGLTVLGNDFTGNLTGAVNSTAASPYTSPVAYGGVDIAATLIRTGTGTPEGVVTAPVGSLFLRTDGSTSTTLYVKTSGSGNTGWTAK